MYFIESSELLQKAYLALRFDFVLDGKVLEPLIYKLALIILYSLVTRTNTDDSPPKQ